jgi:hypothetical protein
MKQPMLNLPIPIGILWVIGIFAFAIIAVVMRRRGKSVPITLIYMLIVYTIGIIMATCAKKTDKNDWAKISFEGRIIEKQVTNNHGMVKFVIQEQDATKRYILDTFWEMKEFKVGDFVTKRSGSREVDKK